MKVAIYQDCGILGSGETLGDALENSGFKLSDLVSFGNGLYSSYDRGNVVDFTCCKRVSSDDEAVSGASAKARRITDRLFDALDSDSYDGVFVINDDGVLDFDID